MKTVRMTQDRNFPEHGLKVAGQRWENVSDELAAQLEKQGFATIETHVVTETAEVRTPQRRKRESEEG